MGDMLLNGRQAEDWELAAIERGHRCERDRDLELLAGVLTGPVPRPVTGARPVTDLLPGLS